MTALHSSPPILPQLPVTPGSANESPPGRGLGARVKWIGALRSGTPSKWASAGGRRGCEDTHTYARRTEGPQGPREGTSPHFLSAGLGGEEDRAPGAGSVDRGAPPPPRQSGATAPPGSHGGRGCRRLTTCSRFLFPRKKFLMGTQPVSGKETSSYLAFAEMLWDQQGCCCRVETSRQGGF